MRLRRQVFISTVQTSTHYWPAVLTPACAGHHIFLPASSPFTGHTTAGLLYHCCSTLGACHSSCLQGAACHVTCICHECAAICIIPCATCWVQAMGVLVSGPGPFKPALLPPMPPGPSVTNLDVTTLCALVSEVSHADPKGPELQAWAQRVTHWRVGTYIPSRMKWN